MIRTYRIGNILIMINNKTVKYKRECSLVYEGYSIN
jgi:hypothetical protein